MARKSPHTPQMAACVAAEQRPGRARRWLRAVVLAWGAQAIVTQTLLLREATVLMYGSEFAWGVVLFAWLAGIAVGAAVGGWLAGRAGVGGQQPAPLGIGNEIAGAVQYQQWHL